jgi:hypothetical protein
MAGQRHRSLRDRLLANSVTVQYPGVVGECWVWIGKLNNKCYGHITMRPKLTPKQAKMYREVLGRRPHARNYMAHRVAYEEFMGVKIDKTMTVDHTCQCPACINPAHHEVVTRVRNSQLQHERKKA